MIRIRRYNSPVAAELAKTFLRRHGVEARVMGHYVTEFHVPGMNKGGFELMLLSDDQKEQAEALLDEYDADEIHLDENWEEETPDLSRLPGGVEPTCSACNATLPADVTLTECTQCKQPVSIVERLIDMYGPDVLADCFEAPEFDDDASEVRDVRCPQCRTTLHTLPVRGRCPSCGSLYDKDELTRRRA